MKHSHFPLFLPCEQNKVLIVGAGTVGTRRIRSLLHFDFTLSVVSLDCSPEVASYHQEGLVTLSQREPQESDFQALAFCLLCTNDPEVNERWGNYAKSQGILQNQCHNKDHCDFYFPAICSHEDSVIALIGTGENHRHIATLRKQIQEFQQEE